MMSDALVSSAAIDASRSGVAMLAIAVSGSAPSAFVVPGPTTIVVLGVAVPALSALLGVIGVIVGQLLAPAGAPLGGRRRGSLMIALIMLELGIVIATGQLPLVAMGWGIGLGFSGLSIAQALGDEALLGVKRIADAFITAITTRIGGAGKDQDK